MDLSLPHRPPPRRLARTSQRSPGGRRAGWPRPGPREGKGRGPLALVRAAAGVALLASALWTPSLLDAQGSGSAGSTAQATTGDAATEGRALGILERASERYGAMQAFCADFRQVVQNDLLRQTTRSAGELCQRRPDRFEMRFTDPAGDRVVADGTHLWAYFPSTDPGQAFRTGAAEAGGRFDLHREFLADPGTRYRPLLQGEETLDGERTFVLALTPRGEAPFLRARLWVDARSALLRRVEITETEGFVRTLDLGAHRVDPPLPDARFRFEPPAGVRVVSP